MEQGLRDCCRSIRIGKILVESDANTHGELQALEKPIIHRAKSKMDEKLFNGSLLNLIYFVEPLSTSNFFFKFPLRNSR